LGATKRERLDEIFKRLRHAAPFRSGVESRRVLEDVMRDVEDEFSGVPENLDAVNTPIKGGARRALVL